MWEQVVGLFPQLADKVDYLEGGSPLTHNYYIKSNAGKSQALMRTIQVESRQNISGPLQLSYFWPPGEIYGLDHDLNRFSKEASVALRPDLGIPGLLFTGEPQQFSQISELRLNEKDGPLYKYCLPVTKFVPNLLF